MNMGPISQPNVGWLFYKHYFSKLFSSLENSQNIVQDITSRDQIIEKKNRQILEQVLPDNIKWESAGNHSFDLVTTYPGLLIGSGYMHELGVKNEFKLGFFFDYTSGLPVISGSSVKGVLRSVFPLLERDKERKAAKYKYVKHLLNMTESDDVLIDQLEKEIFEGIYKGKAVSVYERDIFLDAVPVDTHNSGRRFLGNDFITPHKDNPLKDPIPLQFLKILPGVVFRFRFDLKNSKLMNGQIDSTQKKDLFTKIILDRGVGAKGHVGYGNFEMLNFTGNK